MAAEGEHGGCSATLTLAFGILGKRWNGMILESLSRGPLSFVGVRRAVGGISDAVLADRLSELVEAQLISRSVDDGPPVAVHYELNESGRRLMPVLDDLASWAGAYLQTGETNDAAPAE